MCGLGSLVHFSPLKQANYVPSRGRRYCVVLPRCGSRCTPFFREPFCDLFLKVCDLLGQGVAAVTFGGYRCYVAGRRDVRVFYVYLKMAFEECLARACMRPTSTRAAARY